MREDTDLTKSFEGEEGVVVDFPLSGASWALVFNLLLAWEDYIGEWTRAAWTI
jgi:hypothetical protein